MNVFASMLLALSASVISEIKPDEEVVFFNTWGKYRSETATWRLNLHGWILEREQNSIGRQIFLAHLVKSMDLDDVLDEETERIFKERAYWFLADNERGKAVRARVSEKIWWPMGVSAEDGHFFGTAHLRKDQIKPIVRTTPAGQRWIDYKAITPSDDRRRFGGAVLLMDEVGLSVVSDIDDTIKITGIQSPNTMLANTFIRPFDAVPGMAKLYRDLETAGASFHYISDSPWQLYVVLNEFMGKEGFPAGTWALKRLRIKDEKLFDEKHREESAKKPRIEELLEAFPRRHFILIGDSGQKDPEVYGELARKHTRQVALILIRHVSDESADGSRFQEAFKGLPAQRWHVFRDPKELGALGAMLPAVSTRPSTQPQ